MAEQAQKLDEAEFVRKICDFSSHRPDEERCSQAGHGTRQRPAATGADRWKATAAIP